MAYIDPVQQVLNIAENLKKRTNQIPSQSVRAMGNRIIAPVSKAWVGLRQQANEFATSQIKKAQNIPRVSNYEWNNLKKEASNFLQSTSRFVRPVVDAVNAPYEKINKRVESINRSIPSNLPTFDRARQAYPRIASAVGENFPGVNVITKGLKMFDQSSNLKDYSKALDLYSKGEITRDDFDEVSYRALSPIVVGAVTAPTSKGFSKVGDVLRSTTARGSYTNIKGLDNPLLKGSPSELKALPTNVRKPGFVKEVRDVEKALAPGIKTPVGKKVNVLDYFRTPDRVLEKIGMKSEATFLRQRWDKYVDELPKEIGKINQWFKQAPSPESSKRIFQYLDGQGTQLDSNELRVASEIKSYLSQWANKLGLPKDKRVTDYITHIFEPDLLAKEFDDDLAKLISGKVPGSVYDPFLQKRYGIGGYVEDVWRALDAYTKRAVRKYSLDPALKQIKDKSVDLEQSQLNYLTRYTERLNLRPTEFDNLIDNFIKSTPVGYKFGQRPVNTLTRTGRQAIYRGTLGLNVTTALKNLTQASNTFARIGGKYTTKGYMDLLKNWGSDELQRVGVLADDIIQDRQLSSSRKMWEKIDKGLFAMFETAEKINRGSAYYGAKAKALSQGMDEAKAIEAAKKVVRDTQFTFGNIDTPLALSSDLAKTFAQFQTFNLKQAEFLGEMVSKKDLAGMLRWLSASLAMVYTVGKTIGIEPKDLIPTARFGTPPTLQFPWELGKAVANTPDKYGQPRDLETKAKDVGKSLVPYVPGGVQLKKTAEGTDAMIEGGSFTEGGKLRFEVPPSVKPLLFGIWKTKEAQDYLDKRKGDVASDSTTEVEATVQQRKEELSEEKKIGGRMYLDLKKLQTPEERKALLQTWKDQGLLNEDTSKELKRLQKRAVIENSSKFVKEVDSFSQIYDKATIVKLEMKNKTPEERRKILQELKDAGLLTKGLVKELQKRAKNKQN